jgi:hypothetical protein
MDCKTAQKVWNHPKGFISGVQEHLPGVLELIEQRVKAFVQDEQDPFDTAIKASVGVTQGFSVYHAEDNDRVAVMAHDVIGDLAGCMKLQEHFSAIFHRPLVFSNVCCSGCIVSDPGVLTDDLSLRIQLKAVNTAPDGSSLLISP